MLALISAIAFNGHFRPPVVPYHISRNAEEEPENWFDNWKIYFLWDKEEDAPEENLFKGWKVSTGSVQDIIDYLGIDIPSDSKLKSILSSNNARTNAHASNLFKGWTFDPSIAEKVFEKLNKAGLPNVVTTVKSTSDLVDPDNFLDNWNIGIIFKKAKAENSVRRASNGWWSKLGKLTDGWTIVIPLSTAEENSEEPDNFLDGWNIGIIFHWDEQEENFDRTDLSSPYYAPIKDIFYPRLEIDEKKVLEILKRWGHAFAKKSNSTRKNSAEPENFLDNWNIGIIFKKALQEAGYLPESNSDESDNFLDGWNLGIIFQRALQEAGYLPESNSDESENFLDNWNIGIIFKKALQEAGYLPESNSEEPDNFLDGWNLGIIFQRALQEAGYLPESNSDKPWFGLMPNPFPHRTDKIDWEEFTRKWLQSHAKKSTSASKNSEEPDNFLDGWNLGIIFQRALQEAGYLPESNSDEPDNFLDNWNIGIIFKKALQEAGYLPESNSDESDNFLDGWNLGIIFQRALQEAGYLPESNSYVPRRHRSHRGWGCY